MQTCACGSGQPYADCCGAFIQGLRTPTTPEELMRSRYTAYTKADMDYIARTMKSPALDQFDAKTAKQWAVSIEWIRLEVVASSCEDNKGFVEFLAHFYQNKKRHVLHERSEFHRENGLWYYVDGIAPRDIAMPLSLSQVGRNEACLCGSGKKYKKCCGSVR
jgi:SEC-C motif domain protein